MNDITEPIRRAAVQTINAEVQSDDESAERARLVEEYGENDVWNTKELTAKFEVRSFLAPLCFVTDRATGKKGTVMFQHMPRFYFHWEAD
jgi:hypothetical protein